VTNVAARSSSIRLVVGTLCILALCAGCSVRRVVFNDVVTMEQVNFIRVGQTTILELADTKSAALDFGALARLVLLYSPTLTLNKTGITPEQFQVVFDPQWTVRAYGFSRRTTDKPVVWFWPF